MSIFKLNLKLYFSILLLISNTVLIHAMEKAKGSTAPCDFAEIMARADTPTAMKAIETAGGIAHLNDYGADRLEQVLNRLNEKPDSTLLDRLYDKGLRAAHLLQINYTTGWACTIYRPIGAVNNPEVMKRIRAKFGITKELLPLSRAELADRSSVADYAAIDIHSTGASDTGERK